MRRVWSTTEYLGVHGVPRSAGSTMEWVECCGVLWSTAEYAKYMDYMKSKEYRGVLRSTWSDAEYTEYADYAEHVEYVEYAECMECVESVDYAECSGVPWSTVEYHGVRRVALRSWSSGIPRSSWRAVELPGLRPPRPPPE